MTSGHVHPHPRRAAPRWGDARPRGPARWLSGARAWLRAALGVRPASGRDTLPALPLAMRTGDLATAYLAAERGGDHGRAGAAAAAAMERAIASADWWPADAWGHRSLWHFEREGMALQATRVARRIGELRSAAGDPAAARRYFAEAIAEARDNGAEREEGLAALGLGRAEMQLGHVTTARRLAGIAEMLLERAGAPRAEREAAVELRGDEVTVGEVRER